jgi:hypothetical protein
MKIIVAVIGFILGCVAGLIPIAGPALWGVLVHDALALWVMWIPSLIGMLGASYWVFGADEVALGYACFQVAIFAIALIWSVSAAWYSAWKKRRTSTENGQVI